MKKIIVFVFFLASLSCLAQITPKELKKYLKAEDTIAINNLFSKGFNIDSVFFNRGLTLLHESIFLGKYAVSEWLLNKGANPNTVNVFHDTPIMEAAYSMQYHLMDKMIEHGADVTIRNATGNSVINVLTGNLEYTISDRNGYKMQLEKVMQLDTNINYQCPCNKLKLSYLMNCIYGGADESIIKLFLDKGINVNLQDANGLTAVHIAIEKNRADIIPLLLKAGYDQSITDNKGRTVRELAELHNMGNLFE